MSANIRSLVTADKSALAALTMAPRFMDEQGSSANSEDASLISSPLIRKNNIVKKSVLEDGAYMHYKYWHQATLSIVKCEVI